MSTLDIKKTQFRVADFLDWQRAGKLDLNPIFQRRPVWKPGAKSFFIDTVCRGLPAPVVYIRETIDLDTQGAIREIVDGQQRLRTLFAFIDPNSLPDFDQSRDEVVVKAIHNSEIAGKTFNQLSKELRRQVLGYEFSTHILPINAEDRQILEIFARLNSTGVKLNAQELRNAEFFGAFKTTMYELALEQLDRWREWKIFTNDNLARMLEVELASDLMTNMINGLSGKDQKAIDDIYRTFDDSFPQSRFAARRFRRTMDAIDELIGDEVADTAFKSQVNFFTLFVYIYDRMYDLGSKLDSSPPRKLPSSLKACLADVSNRLLEQRVPANVLDAVQRASTDYGRRKTRLDYVSKLCSAKAIK
jgi:hypothetical protein